MRTLAPSETLIYLETNDLAAALRPMVDSEVFKAAATARPDLSALDGVQVAVAVTGFETNEEKLTDETSVGRVRPRFVAIAETHAWNYQAVAFAERGLGIFVADLYKAEPKIEKSEKHGGKYFTWDAGDGRKAFALVIDSLIYFANDETAIEKCVAVRKDETESLIKAGSVPPAEPAVLARGHVTSDGVGQLAAIVGMQLAVQASDDEEIRSAVAGLLPRLIIGTVKDLKWTAIAHRQGYEDRMTITADADTANVMRESFASTAQVDPGLFQYVWARSPSITLYNLERPNVAWRGLVLTALSKVDGIPGQVIGEFASAFAEPYGVADPELFLSGVGKNIITVRTDAEGDKVAMIASVRDAAAVRRSLDPELKPDVAATAANGFATLKGEDAVAVFAGNFVLLGDHDSVATCLGSQNSGTSLLSSPSLVGLFVPNNSAVSLSVDSTLVPALADVLSERKADGRQEAEVSISETRFSRTGIERRVVSDVGLIGWLIAQLADE